MDLSGLSIRFRPIVLTLVALLIAWGLIAFYTMPRREDPEFVVRSCVVTTPWPGVSAAKIEELVTDKLEEELEKIPEVKTLQSTTITGLSTITVELEDSYPGDDIQNAWDKVRAKVDLVRMPETSIKPIVNDGFGDTTIMVMAVHQTPSAGREEIRSEDRYSPRRLEQFADRIRTELRILDGVSKVEKLGVQNEAIFVETDLTTWSQLGLATAELQSLIQARNIVQPGGEISTASSRYSVKPGGELVSVSDLESIIVGGVESGSSGNPVYLRDLGLKVRRGYEDPAKYYCRVGTPDLSTSCVILGLQMKSGANIVDVCTRAKDRIRELSDAESVLPPDIGVTLVSDQSVNVSAKIQGVVVNVLEAVAIVVLVVLLFVGLRSSIVMAANIPIVVLASIGIISTFGVQLEQISLASIIIALGLLVDNAIQVCDQSRTNQVAGMPPVEATVEGARTLAIPMLVGTLTTVAAFLPMMFALEGSSAEFIYSLPVTITVTLGLSWILAMTFCVILAATFIRASKASSKPASPFAWLAQIGGNLLRRVQRRRPEPAQQRDQAGRDNLAFRAYEIVGLLALKGKWITIAIAIGLFFWAINLPVKSEFFPMDRRDQFAVLLRLPETATINQTNEKVKQLEAIIRKLSGDVDENGNPVERLRAMRTMVGGGGSRWHLSWGPEPASPNFAEILVRTTDGRFTPQYVQDVRRLAQRGDEELGVVPISGVRVIPKELGLGPPSDPLVFRVTGSEFADIDELRRIANRLKQIVRAQPETWDVHDSWGIDGFQLQIEVNENRANLAGVSNVHIANTLNSYFSGLKLTTFHEGDHEVPVYFRLNPNDRRTIDGLQTAFVEGAQRKVPLSAIASIQSEWEPAKIERRDRNRVIEVRSSMEPGAPGNDVTLRVDQSEEMQELRASLGAGYRIEVGGAVEESAKSTSQMITSFGVSFLLIVLCLVFQYNGWAKPFIILITLPLALIGAVPGLYFTDNAMGFMPQLGVLSLFGIVLNTGVIFVEFADIVIRAKRNDKRRAGTLDGPIVGLTRREFRECLVQAGKQRMLPIFLTTATTIGGLIPLALDGGPLWTGLAWTMIFGLTVATLLTLLVVPAIYAILVETFRLKPVAVESSQ
ncbi:MAG: efflux RND transporter permease subunit [Pirellulales bacterium]|nr:efflux RND transporter permease subunit [Pirellulales bacterium]